MRFRAAQDVADSKRVNGGIHRLRSSGPPEDEEQLVSATIVSGLFWPTFQKDELKLPPLVRPLPPNSRRLVELHRTKLLNARIISSRCSSRGLR